MVLDLPSDVAPHADSPEFDVKLCLAIFHHIWLSGKSMSTLTPEYETFESTIFLIINYHS
jgi:hypothetical protein